MPRLGDPQRIVAELSRRGQTIATAESLTGGLLAARLIDVPGASAVCVGGVVSYAPEVKSHLLGVDPLELATMGAVSEGVAIQMATRVREVMQSSPDVTWGVSTTGVAGPDPDPVTGQPPGLVFLAVVGPEGAVFTERLGLVGGSRAEIREATVGCALGLVERALGLPEQ